MAKQRQLKQLYVAWIKFQRRPLTMQDSFGYDLRFVPTLPVNNSVMKALVSYPVQAFQTIYLMLTVRPDVFWIQSPPNILLHMTWLFRLLSAGKLAIIADLHNSAFSKLWFSVPFTRRILNSFDLVLVHNEAVFEMAVNMGIDRKVLHVLEDQVPDFAFGAEQDAQPKGRPYFVAPCSFRPDEPVAEILKAARAVETVDVMVTGDIARAQDLAYLDGKPQNVTFTGFLSREDYEALIAGATGIICLTTEEGIQLSSAIEAVASGKPMIISDTRVLRSLFDTGLFVDNTASTIAGAFRDIVADFPRFAELTRSLRRDGVRQERWATQAEGLIRKLGLH